MATPHFEVISHAEARRIRPSNNRPRRVWAPVLKTLLMGSVVFMADDDLSDGDVKYLSLALARRKAGERLRTARITRGGVPGRVLEVYS